MSRSLEQWLEELDRMPLIARMLERLERELPANLRYHQVQHTREVLAETLRFALHDQLEARKLELLAIAAAYHDAGYIEQYALNEEIGAAMAAQAMRESGQYAEAEIHEVEQMIMSTRVVKGPEGPTRIAHIPLAGYLMDADLGAFGRDDFFEKGDQLLEELGAEAADFDRQTLVMVNNHHWFTPAAEALREAKKQENLKLLLGRLKAS